MREIGRRNGVSSGEIYETISGSTLLLLADTDCLGTIIDDSILEPWVLEGLFGSNANFGIIDEDAAKQVKELFVKGSCCRNKFLSGCLLA